MTRDELLNMASKAGLAVVHFSSTPEAIERFAVLVAAAERDRMISEGWRQCAQGQKTSQFCAVAEQARQKEREECAKVCEDNADCCNRGSPLHTILSSNAAAIRARGQE
jgi:hypothetical protein